MLHAVKVNALLFGSIMTISILNLGHTTHSDLFCFFVFVFAFGPGAPSTIQLYIEGVQWGSRGIWISSISVIFNSFDALGRIAI